MESVDKHVDADVATVDSKPEELKRKSLESKEAEIKNGNDEPVIKKAKLVSKEPSEDKEVDKVTSDEKGDSEVEPKNDEADVEVKETNGSSDHLNGKNGEHKEEDDEEEDDEEESKDTDQDDEDKAEDAPSDDKKSDEESDE